MDITAHGSQNFPFIFIKSKNVAQIVTINYTKRRVLLDKTSIMKSTWLTWGPVSMQYNLE